MDQPAHPVADEEDDRGHDPEREPADRRVDVEPQLRPAVGVLVQAEAERSGAEDDEGERGQADGGCDERPGPLGDDRVEADDEPAGQARHRDQLEEAAPSVVGIGDPARRERVEATEQVGDLEARRRQRTGRRRPRGSSRPRSPRVAGRRAAVRPRRRPATASAGAVAASRAQRPRRRRPAILRPPRPRGMRRRPGSAAGRGRTPSRTDRPPPTRRSRPPTRRARRTR